MIEYEHAADCPWAIGESDKCSCGLDDAVITRMIAVPDDDGTDW